MNKSLRLALGTAAALLLLVYITLFLKLVSLGSANYSHDLGPAWLPIGHIDNSPGGFAVSNGPGSIVIPLLAGLIVGGVHYLAARHTQRG
jgi:hypothetical protein